ncbi:MAG TPA: DegT/DnrJ/EryC1/StrS family aminotransferase [Actinopolymorphaceae bacterium]|jgi:dTDP-4-amino-4,6-dideoxygalactose transaminase|nr:DegT/DnrJ/EryC1/StrS family aminotransferase [Actinopolymorphaceae bacterium]
MTTTNMSRYEPLRIRPWPAWPVWGQAERDAVDAVVTSGVWGGVNAPVVREFEHAWSEFLGVRETRTCSNGTISLQIALRALGIGAGDEVIVPPYTFAATATAVLEENALPVFADIDAGTHCLDPDAVESAVTERTRAVIAVHLGGHPADLDKLDAVCRRHDLALIEDAAQAHGAEWNGRRVGGFGAFGSWSFQASKNLTSGEGGALTTNDPELADLADSLRNCGRTPNGEWYEHHRLGENHRLTAIQAALLQAGLGRLPDQIRQREESAAVLDRELARLDGIEPMHRDPRATAHAYHLYQFRYEPAAFGGLPRDSFANALKKEGIPASVGYSIPLYRQPIFANAAFDHRATGWSPTDSRTRYGDLHLPACERACATTVWLPQALLLAGADEMCDVVAAVEKVQRGQR